MKRIRNERGSFLLQALVLIFILALMAAMMLELVFGRTVAVAKMSSTQGTDFVTQTAQNMAYSCLAGSAVPVENSCSNADLQSALGACGYPASIQGRGVSVSIGASGGLCQLRFSIADAPQGQGS